MRLITPRSTTSSLAIALAVVSIGCGDGRPPLYPVAGRLEFANGAPVHGASVEFVPEGEGPAPRARTDGEGRFTLSTYDGGQGAPAGEYRVDVIQASRPAMAELLAEHADHLSNAMLVSQKHASPETTGLRATVRPVVDNEILLVVESQATQ